MEITDWEIILQPIRVSLTVSLWALGLTWPPAILVGWVLAHREFPGKTLFIAAMMVPVVLPPLIIGYGLLLLLSPRYSLGIWFAHHGLMIPLTQKGAILALAVIGWPYLVTHARQAFQSIDQRLLWVAASHGATPLQRLWSVSLPLALPGILSGGVLAFSRGLGEFGATLILAGSIPGETQTLSLAIYQFMESPSGEPVAWVLVGISLGIVSLTLWALESLTRWTWGRGKFT